MPPKVKITKEKILECALDMVRKNGFSSVNARILAKELGCSTQPIFSNYPTMDALKEDILSFANTTYLNYLKDDMAKNEYPTYKASGMAYIHFAKEEKELFKLLFMRDRTDEDQNKRTDDFEEIVSIVQKNLGISREKALIFHLEMWVCVHGIGAMIATSYLEFDKELISQMLSDSYLGLKKHYLSEEQK
ncbi:MAG: TetR/AcrR family transcriptional regulator [Clostridia bacterium]|nr:TetR/AcrR family transcriptional regulator [Clostridia bacterium]